jgi:hypothetical protein
MAKLTPGLPQTICRTAEPQEHGAVVMTLSLKHALSPQGIIGTTSQAGGLPLPLVGGAHNFLKPEYFGGDHILYNGDYLEVDTEFSEKR